MQWLQGAEGVCGVAVEQRACAAGVGPRRDSEREREAIEPSCNRAGVAVSADVVLLVVSRGCRGGTRGLARGGVVAVLWRC